MSSIFLDALAGPRLYPLTDRRLSQLSHAQQVLHLSDGGAKLVQLREKILSPLEFYREAVEALFVARERGVKIIINDRVDIALAIKAHGVHLGQDDLPPDAARRLLGPEVIVGFSTHNVDQARLAAKMPVDYIAIGPIFPTTSKQSAQLPIGLNGLRQVRQAVGNIPVVAIGGITFETSQDVLDAGANAISVISNIWTSSELVAAQTKRLLHRSK